MRLAYVVSMAFVGVVFMTTFIRGVFYKKFGRVNDFLFDRSGEALLIGILVGVLASIYEVVIG